MQRRISFAMRRSRLACAGGYAKVLGVVLVLALQACAPLPSRPYNQKELATTDQLSQLVAACPFHIRMPSRLALEYPDLKIVTGAIRTVLLPNNTTRSTVIKTSTGIPRLDAAVVETVEQWTCAQPSPLTAPAEVDIPFAFALDRSEVPPPTFTLKFAGIHTVDSFERIDDPNSTSGKRQLVKGFRPLEPTHTVVGKLGTRMGIAFTFEWPHSKTPILYKRVWRFPAPGLTNPSNQKHADFNEVYSHCELGKECTAGFSFGEPWEIVHGTWGVEIWVGTELVHKTLFDVIPE